MTDLSQNLYTAAQIRAIEQAVINDFGVPGYTLMQTAGRSVCERGMGDLPPEARVLVLCGPGNNGGDGYVVAAQLKSEGHTVQLISLTDPANLKGDAALARDDWTKTGGEIERFGGELPQADLIIDALLGTGLGRPLAGDFLVAVQEVNEADVPVIAIDIPTGLSSETGMPLGSAVHATRTVTFIGLKLGLLSGKGKDYCGEVTLDDLDSPEAAYEGITPEVRLIDGDELRLHLPPRKHYCNKGNFGHVLIAGGDHGMSGAVRMASEAAARVGGGLVSVATRVVHAALINQACPVVMSHGSEDGRDLNRLLERATVLAAGPGLGRSEWSRACWQRLSLTDLPMVVDADALNLLALSPRKRDDWILTPHPGEAARLLGVSTAEVQHNRVETVRELQRQYGGVIALKGLGTLIYDGSRSWLCDAGNPGMASGGMGDVLTGIVAGLVAQGLDLSAAARMGVFVHARAADLAAGNRPRGMLATDLFPYLREVVNP